MRRALRVTLPSGILVGTMHEPAGATAEGAAVLLLNGGPIARAWNSDLPVELADDLASRGIRTFRFDPPGLGDSPGAMPEFVEFLRRRTMSGEYDRVIVELADYLCQTYAVERLYAGGLCLGTVLSIRAAAADPDRFAGLILFEPHFRGPAPPQLTAVQVVAKPEEARVSGGQWLANTFGRERIKRTAWLGPLRGPLTTLVGLLRKHQLSPQAHPGLAASWRKVVEIGVPTLLVYAGNGSGRWLADRIMEWLPARAVRRSIELHQLAGTNHAFNEGDGQKRACALATDWVLGRLARKH